MFRATAIIATALALTSCADPKYLERDSGPTAQLKMIQAGRVNAFTYDINSPKRIMLLRINEPTKLVKVPAGVPFPVRFWWDGFIEVDGPSLSGCAPELQFVPQVGYTYTLQPGADCQLSLTDQDGNTPPIEPINWKH